MTDLPPHGAQQELTPDDPKSLLSEMSDKAVAVLLQSTPPETVAHRLGAHVGKTSLSPVEREVALQVLRTMLDGAELQVRCIIAETLKSSPYLPRDIAIALANDVEAVALPVLAFSEVLTDDDLIAIIEAGSAAKQIKIAERREVPAKVADAIIGTQNGAAVATLVSNQGATLDETLLDRAASRFGTDPRVTESLRKRPNLPIQITERLVTFTMESLRSFIGSRTHLTPEIVDQLILKTREAATIDLLAPYLPAEEAVKLAQHLHKAGRLTPSLVLRALCLGDLGLFEAAMASLASIPIHNARMLIHDSGPRGLSSLAERAGLPAAYLPALRSGLRYLSEMLAQGLDEDRSRFRRVMIERMLSRYDGLADDMKGSDLDYLLIRLDEPSLSAA